MPCPKNTFLIAIIPNRKLAVIVFIPGGGFATGGIDDDFSGPDFLVEKDVVLVTMNYRLNVFGFMSLGSDEFAGHMGLNDQQLALRWVQRHIGQFGGDAERVTLVGSSAGAAAVHFHMTSASSKGLFRRAILMSGSAGNFWSTNTQVDHRQQMWDLGACNQIISLHWFIIIRQLAQTYNSSIGTFADLVDWLQRAPASHLLAQNEATPNAAAIVNPHFRFPWAPVVASKFIYI